MTGGRQEIDTEGAAARVRASVNGIEIAIEQPYHYPIGIIVIVAIVRRLIEQELPQAFLALEIDLEGCQQCLHIEGFFIVDMVFNSGRGVCQGAQSHPLDIG